MFLKNGFTPLEILRGEPKVNMKKTNKFLTGFTLIELLVVIAIIGILASIVLVAFPSATKKANDARVEASISQARAVMTSYQSNNGTYVGFSCTDTPNVGDTPNPSEEMTALCADIVAKSYGGGLTIQTSADAACIYASLNAQDGATWYCADSTGIAGVTATDPGTADCSDTAGSYTCPSDTAL